MFFSMDLVMIPGICPGSKQIWSTLLMANVSLLVWTPDRFGQVKRHAWVTHLLTSLLCSVSFWGLASQKPKLLQLWRSKVVTTGYSTPHSLQKTTRPPPGPKVVNKVAQVKSLASAKSLVKAFANAKAIANVKLQVDKKDSRCQDQAWSSLSHMLKLGQVSLKG